MAEAVMEACPARYRKLKEGARNMASDRSARTLYGLSPYADSVRTETAHFVSYSSYLRPKVDVIRSYSLRTRGFIRGSIPLSSTIKRLVRRGSGKAYGQKPKMYGHADRIDRRALGSEKVPELLDCCVLSAYSCPMTTSENAQRDELARDIFLADNSAHPNAGAEWDAFEDIGGVCGGGYAYGIADGLLAAGYRKPRTITTVEELDAAIVRSFEEGENLVLLHGWRPWIIWENDHGYTRVSSLPVEGDPDLFSLNDIPLPVVVLHEPEAEVGA